MIGKIKNLAAGPDLARLHRYLAGPENERVAALETRNLATDSLPDSALVMDAQAGLSVRAKKPIAHLTISYAPEDRVSPEEMTADADRLLKALGAQDAQAVIVIHSDKHYPHFHVSFNRVSADGRCISDSNSKRKIETVLRKIESERGLRPVPGRHAPVIGRAESGRFKGTRAASRGYVQPPTAVIEAMRQARSRHELDARLGQLGWRLDTVQPKPGQKAGGLVLRGPAGAQARASDCGRDCSGPSLARRFSTPTASQPPQIRSADTAPLPAPKPTGAQALASALRKAKTRPRVPRIAPIPSVTGMIRRGIPHLGPRLKF